MGPCARFFNTNMIKIALNMEEDHIAASIVALYPVLLDESTIDFAIVSHCMHFIKSMFFFEKTDYSEIP